jgi:hypothetical protein
MEETAPWGGYTPYACGHKTHGGFFMIKSKLFLAGILASALVFGLTAAACSSTTGFVETAGWSNYTTIPNKDYTVVGSVVIRTDDTKTINADLMTEAVKLGADDIINVRLDTEVDDKGKQKIVAATAVAIKYAETLTSSITTTTTPDQGTSITTTDPVMGSSGGGTGGSAGGSTKKKGLLGLGGGFLGL